MSRASSRKRIFWLGIPAILIGSALVFRIFFAGLAVEWLVRGELEERFGYIPQYDEAVVNGDQVVFKRLVLLDSLDRDEGGYRIEIERAELRYTVEWLSQRIHLDLRLIQPNLFAKRTQRDQVPEFFWRPREKNRWFTLEGAVRVDDGLVQFERPYRGSTQIQKIYFSGKTSLGLGAKGNLEVAFDETAGEKNTLSASFALDGLDLTSDLQVSKVSLEDVFSVGEFWVPVDHQLVEVGKGDIDGHLSLLLPAGKKASVDGELSIHRPTFVSDRFGFKTEAPTVNLQFTGFGPRKDSEGEGLILTGELVGDGRFVMGGPDTIDWTVDQLSGRVSIAESGLVRWNLEGVSFLSEDPSRLRLEGVITNPGTDEMDLSVTTRMVSNLKEDVSATFKWKWVEGDKQAWGIGLSHIGPDEFAVGQAFLRVFHPIFGNVQFAEGHFSAEMTALGSPALPEEVAIKSFEADQLKFDVLPLGLRATCDRMVGKGLVDLIGSRETVGGDADLEIQNGALRFVGLYNQIWECTDIQADVRVRNGVPEKSEVTGRLAGLETEVELNWTAKDDLAQILLHGSADELIQLFPPDLRKKLLPQFGSNSLELEASLRAIDKGVQLEGLLKVSGENKLQDRLRFGCDIEGLQQSLASTTYQQALGRLKRRQLEILAIRRLSPVAAAPAAVLTSKRLHEETLVYGLNIRNGWAKANNLPLGEYVGPFIFKDPEKLTLSGSGDIEVAFDQNKLTVRYNGSDVSIDGPALHIEVDQLGSRTDLAKKNPFPAVHFFDFEEKTHFGFIPLHNARYHQKKFDLWFSKADADVVIEGQSLHVTNIETLSAGVEFLGRIDLDYSDPTPGAFGVEIRTERIQGQFEEVSELFKHFGSDVLGLIPLQGHVVSALNGGHLSLSFSPTEDTFKGTISGSLLDGLALSSDGGVAAEKVSLNFHYDSEANALVFTDVMGELRVGEGDQVDRYRLRSRSARIYDFPKPKMEFDLRVEGATHDLVRIVGSGEEDHDDPSIIHFKLDEEKTHFGRIYPRIDELSVRNWNEPVSLRARPQAELAALSDDLERLSRSGWLVTAHHEVGFLKDVEIRGRVSGKAELIPGTTTYLLEASGEDITFEGTQIRNASFQGKKQGNRWSIEQLQLDNISVATDLTQHDDYWDISFLGLRYGTSVLVGIEGKYLVPDRRFETSLKLLEIDLERLREFRFFTKLAQEWKPQGKIRASGDLFIDFARDKGGYTVLADFDADLNALEFGGMRLANERPISCHFDSSKGIRVDNLSANVLKEGFDPEGVKIHVDSFDYLFTSKDAEFKGFHFRLPADQLPKLAGFMKEQYPEKFTDMMAEALSGLKQDEDLVALADVKLSPGYQAIRLALAEGTYHFGSSKHVLKDFVLEYDPYELKVDTQYQYRDYDYRLSGRTSANSLNFGQAEVSPVGGLESNGEKDQPLIVFWEWKPDQGFTVNRLDGRLLGLEIHLSYDEKTSSEDLLVLEGQVHFDGRKMLPLLSGELARLVQKWDVGSGYEALGTFQISKKDVEKFGFTGSVSGRDFHLMGYELKTLHVDVDLSDEKVELADLLIADTGGKIRVDRLSLNRSRFENWRIDMPLFLAEEFKPSLLTPVEGESSGPKPLVVRKAELRDVEGDLSDLHTLTGHGYLSFINPSKSNLRNTLLAIPSELMARIGISSDLLTPVVGEINYELRDAKLVLTQFKDVYSEGRLSRFYLPTKNYQSSVDFEGNLDLRVRMKQYNLIFKIAELFTISIHGTIKDPKFSLNKQEVTQREAELEEEEYSFAS